MMYTTSSYFRRHARCLLDISVLVGVMSPVGRPLIRPNLGEEGLFHKRDGEGGVDTEVRVWGRIYGYGRGSAHINISRDTVCYLKLVYREARSLDKTYEKSP